MDNFTLKWIAILCMLIDHIGAVFTPYEINGFRIIGRLAFPIFCFLLVEGFCHTHNMKQYLLRMAAFVLISELPYDVAFHGGFSNQGQNVFFTLFIGLVVLYCLKSMEEKAEGLPLFITWTVKCLIITAGCFAAYVLKTDYDVIGILLIVSFYLFRGRFLLLLVSGFMLLSFNFSSFPSISVEIYAMFSYLFIFLYNGEKGRSMKYFFYVFYPAHLMILYFISIRVG